MYINKKSPANLTVGRAMKQWNFFHKVYIDISENGIASYPMVIGIYSDIALQVAVTLHVSALF